MSSKKPIEKKPRGRSKNTEEDTSVAQTQDQEVRSKKKSKKKDDLILPPPEQPVEDEFIEGANDLIHVPDNLLQDELIRRGFIPEYVKILPHWQLVYELRKIANASVQTDSKRLEPQTSIFSPIKVKEEEEEEEKKEDFNPDEFKQLGSDDELPNGFIKKYNDMLIQNAVPQEVVDSLPDNTKQLIQNSLKSNSNNMTSILIKYIIPVLEERDQ